MRTTTSLAERNSSLAENIGGTEEVTRDKQRNQQKELSRATAVMMGCCNCNDCEIYAIVNSTCVRRLLPCRKNEASKINEIKL